MNEAVLFVNHQEVALSFLEFQVHESLYRGDPDLVNPSLVPKVPSSPSWFTSSQTAAASYGVPVLFQVTQKIQVLNFGDLVTRNFCEAEYRKWALRKKVPSGAFAMAYPLSESKTSVLRDSTYDTDSFVTQWFLESASRFQGFGTPEMQSDSVFTVHHSELFLKQPNEYLTVLGYVPFPTDDFKTQEYAYRKMEKRQAQARQQRKTEAAETQGPIRGTRLQF